MRLPWPEEEDREWIRPAGTQGSKRVMPQEAPHCAFSSSSFRRPWLGHLRPRVRTPDLRKRLPADRARPVLSVVPSVDSIARPRTPPIMRSSTPLSGHPQGGLPEAVSCRSASLKPSSGPNKHPALSSGTSSRRFGTGARATRISSASGFRSWRPSIMYTPNGSTARPSLSRPKAPKFRVEFADLSGDVRGPRQEVRNALLPRAPGVRVRGMPDPGRNPEGSGHDPFLRGNS